MLIARTRILRLSEERGGECCGDAEYYSVLMGFEFGVMDWMICIRGCLLV